MSDGREALDARIDSSGREGLTGTAPASIYRPLVEADQVTTAPDGAAAADQPAWRTDFAIDWPQNHYVERREFMKFLVLTSLAFTVGQFWIGAQDWWRRRRNAAPRVLLGSLSEIPVGGIRTFTYPGENDPCVLVRTGERTAVAYNQKCTHLSCAVVPQPADGVIRCPCHDGIFDLASGRPLAGPPRRPLVRVLLDIRDDQVFATGIETSTT